MKYCPSLFQYKRFETREVQIGDTPLGGNHPIRVQSMTTTDTMDTKATVEQSIRMIEVGCEYVRITAPSKKEAENLANIQKEIRKAGYNTPLVADIHFTPNAAEIAARIVNKVRVNPGNYVDKKKFQLIDYTESQYNEEIDRIRERFTPLVKICKEYGTAMRIGTNHGSLSDRIMSRYGDTPLGMVESAFEFLRVCEDLNYHNIVLSMKASNTHVMVEAYRMLVAKMMESGRNYPLHLGVTEAGEAEDGRIKSAVGIGALLEDGIGDTVRVSLTEAPEAEMPVTQRLIERYAHRDTSALTTFQTALEKSPFEYHRRPSIAINSIGGDQVPKVIADFGALPKDNPLELKAIGYNYDVLLDKWHIGDLAADFIYLGHSDVSFEIPGTLQKIFESSFWLTNRVGMPYWSKDEFFKSKEYHAKLNFVRLSVTDLKEDSVMDSILSNPLVVGVLESDHPHWMAEMRSAMAYMTNQGIQRPLIIKRNGQETSDESFLLRSATDIGGLLVDGLGDGVWLTQSDIGNELSNSTAFGILQAARTRMSKTEYISCPSCGRTLFDLQETTAKIRAKTDHLKGVKIGIMGCIVNGPGEMADADYGYVGSGPGKITLYKGQEVMKKNVPAENALDELIELIEDDGNWVGK